jgi:hypothetical protein
VLFISVRRFQKFPRLDAKYHHISTIIVLGSTIIVIPVIGRFSMSHAIQLQEQSYSVRSNLLGWVLELEFEGQLNGSGEPASMAHTSKTKNILRQFDESVNFEAIIYKPTLVLGYRADNRMIGSVLGVLVTGSLLAVHGFGDTAIAYTANGWSVY